MGYDFNQIIEKDILPQSLKYLQFGDKFNKSINNVLSNSLQTLICGKKIIKKFIIPNELKMLVIRKSTFECINNFPQLLEKLYFIDDFLASNGSWFTPKINRIHDYL